MKALKKTVFSALLACTFIIPAFATKTQKTAIVEAVGTGYTEASDVDYVRSGNYVANWGARDEDCVFLSTYAENFYTGNYVYEVLSETSGGTGKSDAPSSDLYESLQKLMSSKHAYQTSYNATRDLFCYTDCLEGNYSKISSFYSGKTLSGTWDGGKTWNREHTWPNSKGDKSGNGENDIMMLRPASVSENSSRGNNAYGESGGYYDPNGEGQSVRGDCARIVLYQYVRWECTNTGSNYNPKDIFGTKGVIESLTVLLRWMEEDPVDTWEMGRNDAVQSITGTRNVFVDYPEYAWLLFGQEIPDDMTTPSGMAKAGNTDSSSSSSTEESSSSSDSSVEESSSLENSSEEISSSEEESSSVVDSSEEESSSVVDSSEEESSSAVDSSEENTCEHEYGRWYTIKKPTETEEGERERFCQLCGHSQKESIPVVAPDSSSLEESSEDSTFVEESSEDNSSLEESSEETDSTVESSTVEESSVAEENSAVESSAKEEGSAAVFGCSSSVGASLGGVLVLLTACSFIYKRKKKE